MTLITKKMTIEDWINIEDNPAQRDTARHAAKAIKSHLKEYSPTHATVAAASLNGHLIKLDGHTRALLWSEGKLTRPSELVASLYPVNSTEEAIQLYKQFDNSSAAELGTDRACGALRLNGIIANNTIVKYGRFTTSVFKAESVTRGLLSTKGLDIYKAVSKWKSQIAALDRLNPPQPKFPSWVITAFLLTHRKRGDECLEFWETYRDGYGSKNRDGADGALMLERYLDVNRGKTTSNTANANTGKAVAACESFMRGHIYTSGLKSIDLYLYIGVKKSEKTTTNKFQTKDIEGAYALALEFIKGKKGFNMSMLRSGISVGSPKAKMVLEMLIANNEILDGGAGWYEVGGKDENSSELGIAREIFKSSGKASISFLQRKMRVGYNRAARIVESLEEEGFLCRAGTAQSPYVISDNSRNA